MEKRFVDRFKALEALDKNSTAWQKQQRGRDFEILINDVFEHEGLLLERGMHTDDNKSEQIDGLIQIDHRNFLLEIKWQHSSIPVSSLYSFQGKIDNKFSETKGLFISRNPLSANFLDGLTKGRSRSVLVVHGEDLNRLFDLEGPSFLNYLRFCINKLSVSNFPHYSVADYEKHLVELNFNAQIKRKEEVKRSSKDFIDNFIITKSLVDWSLMKRHYVLATDRDAYPIILKFVLCNFIKRYQELLNDKDDKSLFNHLSYLMYVQLDQRIPIKITERYFGSVLLSDILRYGNTEVLEFFRGKYPNLHRSIHRKFERSLLELFQNKFGKLDYENQITEIYIAIKSYLGDEIQKAFFSLYLEIFISDREGGSAQKDISFFLVTNEQIPKSFIDEWISRKTKEILDADRRLTEEQKISETRQISLLGKYIGLSDQGWQDYIISKFKAVTA